MTHRHLIALLFAVLAPSACSTSTGLGGNTGSVEVTTTTTGEDIDPDGYTITVGIDQRPIGVNATVTFTGLQTNIYAVTLGDVADNCEIDGSNPRSAPVVIGPPVEIDYVVTCVAIS